MEAINRLLAIEEIRNLKHKYFRAIDMADYELLSTIFTDDITVDYRGGTYRWQASGRDEIITSMKYSFHDQTCAMHTGHHPEIEIIDSNNAEGLWYLHDIFYNFNENIITQGTALYKDKYVYQDSKWLIQFSEYDRISESIVPIAKDQKFTKVHLKEHGIKLEKK